MRANKIGLHQAATRIIMASSMMMRQYIFQKITVMPANKNRVYLDATRICRYSVSPIVIWPPIHMIQSGSNVLHMDFKFGMDSGSPTWQGLSSWEQGHNRISKGFRPPCVDERVDRGVNL